MKLFKWYGFHTYIGVAETVEEARSLAINSIRKYYGASFCDEYPLTHEREVEKEPEVVLDLPCGTIVVNYE